MKNIFVPGRLPPRRLILLCAAGGFFGLTSAAAAAPMPHDAVLLVGGRPDAMEVPSLDMALRAQKACDLLFEGKAYYLLIAGNACNNSRSMLETIDSRLGDRSKEERIRSGEMLAVIAMSRGIGRLAIRLRPDPADIPPLCREMGLKKVLCVGDGAGPEKPAADGLKALGVAVSFVKPYEDLEQAKKKLVRDCPLYPLTDEERDSTNLKDILADLGGKDVEVLLVKGGRDCHTSRLMSAVRLYKAGIGKYIFPTGGAHGYINFGEIAMIVCVGCGIPPDRVIYGPVQGSSRNFASVRLWIEKKSLKDTDNICCGNAGAGPGYSRQQLADVRKQEVRFWVWNYGKHEYKVLLPTDHARKVEEILSELKEEAARWQAVARTGTPPEREYANARLWALTGRQGQLNHARMWMDLLGNEGRSMGFPRAPWDWDGVSDHPSYHSYGEGNMVARGVVGGEPFGSAALGHLISDFGSRGPWREWMDAKIQVVPDRWSAVPPYTAKGLSAMKTAKQGEKK